NKTRPTLPWMRQNPDEARELERGSWYCLGLTVARGGGTSRRTPQSFQRAVRQGTCRVDSGQAHRVLSDRHLVDAGVSWGTVWTGTLARRQLCGGANRQRRKGRR
ncbi:MAG: hypothetical protein WBM48_08125, partial [Polyangiales bacterium]